MHAFLSTLGPFLILGFLLKLFGFGIRDVLALRIMVASGLGCDALHYALRNPPIWGSSLLNVCLVAINLVLLVLIVLDRTTLRMSDTDRRLYGHFQTFTPGQFRRLRRLMQDETAPPGAQLTTEGAAMADLLLVDAPVITIRKQGQSFPIGGTVFIGEVAYLTGDMASADVILPQGGVVHRMSGAALRRLTAQKPAIGNALIALFGRDLARKLADSAPMARANPMGQPTGAAAPIAAAL